MEVKTGQRSLTIRLRDRGVGFDPVHIKTSGLDSLPEGGLGIFIILRSMDDVSYYREAGTNVVSMTKRF
jgi:anti-sigma regulatory factor (Ser/Thr protein kinase)